MGRFEFDGDEIDKCIFCLRHGGEMGCDECRNHDNKEKAIERLEDDLK